jgi:hypothetical protein
MQHAVDSISRADEALDEGRFSEMNQVAGGFLGDLGVDRFLERPGPTSVAREDHICDGQILRWPLRGVNSMLV